MSKSLGNFVTINDLLETGAMGDRAWLGDVLRLAMLMTHYREPIDFTVKRLEEAEAKLRDWQLAARDAERDDTVMPDAAVLAALSDDLNFHRAGVVLDAMAKKARAADGAEARQTLAATLRFLGFGLASLITSDQGWEEPPHIATAIGERLAALNARDFARADMIRNELGEQGIALLDYKDSETGERRTKWEMKR
jgi:cysteinyl-tRNA synthetase